MNMEAIRRRRRGKDEGRRVKSRLNHRGGAVSSGFASLSKMSDLPITVFTTTALSSSEFITLIHEFSSNALLRDPGVRNVLLFSPHDSVRVSNQNERGLAVFDPRDGYTRFVVKDANELSSLLPSVLRTDCEPIARPFSHLFGALPYGYLAQLEVFFNGRGHWPEDKVAHGYPLFVLPRETPIEPPDDAALPDTLVSGPLLSDDVELIFRLWPYSMPWSLRTIAECVDSGRPTCGVRVRATNELVAWAVTRCDFSIGMMHVQPEWRKLGLASLLVRSLVVQQRQCVAVNPAVLRAAEQDDAVAKELAAGVAVHCFIEASNVASIALFTKLGFVRTGEPADWKHFAMSKTT